MTTSISFACRDAGIAKKVYFITKAEIKRLGHKEFVAVQRYDNAISVKSLIKQDIDELLTRLHYFAFGACDALEKYGNK